FQYPEYQLFEENVLKDVCYGPKNLGFSKEEQEEKARAALSAVGLSENLYEKSPFEISGGEKRRVAIAGVLAMEPEVLILDEPTAGLDPLGKSQILELLKKYQQERHVTVILVSHSMEEVAQYADRVIALHKAKVVLDGSTRDVFSHRQELEEIGLGVPEVCAFTQSIGLGDTLTVEEAAEKILQMYKL
ncbi:MAG: energy-coupling factor transporter ATPase, partial [Lachnospiraceae bacterium]|nr:energy-coupling factor transporter ATPase [Lachnospiraceae bacterium]